ncbi:membrane transport protein-domain-containing protein [Suillus paluster]|uniref:membrane transport protein-domain-containing protein n=1 Tax=Suillus paluster TaxID=48578 RepID=UPI001B877ADC|nr:membrane transport protein-domain-containing protein [Suillus paluster]KAG1730937.1 membrane transport protein-domain-containing protein [Suillus paluster]
MTIHKKPPLEDANLDRATSTPMTGSIPFGTLFWIAARPLLRLFTCVACGYAITRVGCFSASAARGAGQVVLNITLPSLIFSRAASVLNVENDAALGPLLVIAAIYMAIGFALSLSIKQFFWVPHRFRYGIIVAGGWASIGDMTVSVILDIMASFPFDGEHDQDLAVAYSGVFYIIFYITLFTCGRELVKIDFTGPDIDDGEVKQLRRAKRCELLVGCLCCAKGLLDMPSSENDAEAGQQYDLEARKVDAYSDLMTSKSLLPQISSLEDSQAVSALALSPTLHYDMSGRRDLTIGVELHIIPPSTENSSTNQPRPVMQYMSEFLRCLSSPVFSSVVVSLIVSRISVLKALFIPNVSGTNIPPAPDGQPPLAFIMDAATFLGGANAPLGLIILGSALARMSIPRRRWTSLPLGAIGAFAVGKQLLMPIFGILICEGFTRIGFIDPEDKVFRFVILSYHSIVSCLPISLTQVILTQACSDTSTTEHIFAFLLPQYILMIGVMTVLMAYTLNLLFG